VNNIYAGHVKTPSAAPLQGPQDYDLLVKMDNGADTFAFMH
jgi:hypothetical protein